MTIVSIGVRFYQEVNTVGTIEVADPEVTFAESANAEDSVLSELNLDPIVDRTTILLVGSDSREGLTDAQLEEIGTDDSHTDLTDTVIVVQIDPATDTAALLSFPRDLVLVRCDGSRGRINGAYHIGESQREGSGMECLRRTIENETRINIDHVMRVNFAGFVDAVDALGGVTFYVDEPIQDRWSGLDIPAAGCVNFDGVKALQFVRTRHVDSDFGRIARQQRFAREMIDKATSVGTLSNPVRISALIDSISEFLETDSSFSTGDMLDLANSVRSFDSNSLETRTVPAYTGWLGESAVVFPIEDEADELYRAFRNGDLLPTDVGTAPPSELTPQNVIPVAVINGTAINRAGPETADVLESLGFRVQRTTIDAGYGQNESQIRYPARYEAHAQTLSAALGGIPVVQNDSETFELQLIIGRSFQPSAYTSQTEEEETAPSDHSDVGTTNEARSEDPTEETFVGATVSDVDCD